MNRRKVKGILFLISGLVCLITVILLWVVFAVHCFEYYAIPNLGGMTAFVYGISLILELMFIALVLSVGTVFSWLGYIFTDTEKLKIASKITVVTCMVMLGISILGIVYFLFIQKI